MQKTKLDYKLTKIATYCEGEQNCLLNQTLAVASSYPASLPSWCIYSRCFYHPNSKKRLCCRTSRVPPQDAWLQPCLLFPMSCHSPTRACPLPGRGSRTPCWCTQSSPRERHRGPPSTSQKLANSSVIGCVGGRVRWSPCGPMLSNPQRWINLCRIVRCIAPLQPNSLLDHHIIIGILTRHSTHTQCLNNFSVWARMPGGHLGGEVFVRVALEIKGKDVTWILTNWDILRPNHKFRCRLN